MNTDEIANSVVNHIIFLGVMIEKNKHTPIVEMSLNTFKQCWQAQLRRAHNDDRWMCKTNEQRNGTGTFCGWKTFINNQFDDGAYRVTAIE